MKGRGKCDLPPLRVGHISRVWNPMYPIKYVKIKNVKDCIYEH